MKRTILLLVMCCVYTITCAQRGTMVITKAPDSLKTRRLKHNDLQQSDGITMGTAKDIVENLNHQPKFTILLKAIRVAGLAQTFKSNGPITLFAPTNEAFQKLPKGKLDTLMKRRHILDMSALLTAHAVAGRISTKDLSKQIDNEKGKAKLTTLGGTLIFASKEGENIIITDESGNKSTIATGDFQPLNGYIHVINGVIIPKAKVI